MLDSPYELLFYQTAEGDQPARRWMKELTPTKRRALGMALNEVLAREGIGVCDSQWGKALGGGLYEFRLRDDDPPGGKILLRLFFHPFGDKNILLLCGYDKGEHTSKRYQEEQIGLARRRLADHILRSRR